MRRRLLGDVDQSILSWVVQLHLALLSVGTSFFPFWLRLSIGLLCREMVHALIGKAYHTAVVSSIMVSEVVFAADLRSVEHRMVCVELPIGTWAFPHVLFKFVNLVNIFIKKI